ncbi:transposase [Rhizobium sp. BK602]|uniref:transposase n=1 Tax=Rhizobium sp. BK602 TaxID=2586986 RepID=UPI00160D847E|nr:transposase [Rhizobium sp. BK602]MBB3610657.1 putative transposase [Rhizobium sp. BK602]
MADKNNGETAAVIAGADTKANAQAAKRQKSPRRQKAVAELVQPAVKTATAKPSNAKSKRHSATERHEKLKLIEAQVSESISTLKDAIKNAGISEKTYYLWKQAVKSVAPRKDKPAVTSPAAIGDELSDLVQLEKENQRLRKVLAEKLRAENAELRKKLGLN